MKPLCIDLFCGLGSWAEGFLAEGYDVIGFDIERHDYGTGGYPGQLVIQDVLTLQGSQFKDADVIVASPPCQKYSYMAMPWTRSKKLAAWYRESSERIGQLNALFDACFRIQREAIEGFNQGRVGGNSHEPGPIPTDGGPRSYIPLIVENVRGAQPWVGSAAWTFGSYYLWGDVPAIMPKPSRAQKFNPDGTSHPQGSWFKITDSINRGTRSSVRGDGDRNRVYPGGEQANANRCIHGNALKNPSARVESETAADLRCSSPGPDGCKVPGISFSGFGSPGYKPRDFNVTAAQRYREGVKNGNDWFGAGENCSLQRRASSRSNSRKAASAHIAKIPFPLAQHIARVYKPSERAA